MNFVLDNSVSIRWLLPSEKASDNQYAVKVLKSLRELEAGVPSLWALEASNVISRSEARNLISEANSQAFIELLSRLNITTDKATASQALGMTLSLARRYKLSAYDAAYLELALREGIPLATLDADLIKAAKKAGVPHFVSN